MNKVVATILIVLAMLALGYPRGDVVIAETEQTASIFGFELQFRLKLQLVRVPPSDSAAIEPTEDSFVADTLEAL